MVARSKRLHRRWGYELFCDEAQLHAASAKLADNLAFCSTCWGCANPRKTEGRLTLPEQHAVAELAEFLTEGLDLDVDND